MGRPPAPPASSPMPDSSYRHNVYYQAPPPGSAPPPISLHSNDWYSPNATYRTGSRAPAEHPRRSSIPTPTSPDHLRPEYPRRSSEASQSMRIPSFPERTPENYPIPQSLPSISTNQSIISPSVPYHRNQFTHHQYHPLSPSQSTITASSQSPCPSESSSDQFSERPAQRRRTTPSSASSYERNSFEPDDTLDTKRPRSSRSRTVREASKVASESGSVKGRPKVRVSSHMQNFLLVLNVTLLYS